MAGVAYDDKKYRKGVNVSYYDKATDTYKKQQEANRKTQIKDAKSARDASLRQAYVAKMQNQQQLNDSLTSQGIRGGATETANLQLATAYGNQRAAARSDYANSVNSINRGIDQNIADYTADMMSRKEQRLQDVAMSRWQAAREDYNTAQQWKREDKLRKEQNAREDKIRKEQYKREDETNAYNRTTNEKNRLTDYWSSYYTNYYSGFSKKDLDNALTYARQNLNNAKTYADRIRFQQKISAIQARRGVINNK